MCRSMSTSVCVCGWVCCGIDDDPDKTNVVFVQAEPAPAEAPAAEAPAAPAAADFTADQLEGKSLAFNNT